MRLRHLPVLLICWCVQPFALDAQSSASPDERAGFLAIILTPVGALPSIVQVRGGEAVTPRGHLEVRYSRYRFRDGVDDFQNIGIAGAFRLTSRIEAGATVGHRSCGNCEGLAMASADLTVAVWHRNAPSPDDGDTDIRLLLSAGYGEPGRQRFNARSLSAGVPIAITLPQQHDGMLSLYVLPTVAYGYINDGSGSVLGRSGGDGAIRLVMAAGVGYSFAIPLSLHLGVHRVIIHDSPTQLGVGASWRFGPR
jgi:hypothetical protein